MRRAIPRHSVNLSVEAFETILKAIGSGQVLEGCHLPRFEDRFARYIGVNHAIGISSARAGLCLALGALGLKPDDEVILAAYNFHIIPLIIRAVGLRPVFVDADPKTYNIDISSLQKSISRKTRAVIVTHLFGRPCDIEPILKITKRHNLKTIEDCAHSLGADYEGRKVGSFGHIGLFSFGTGKNMPCFGGGMITTDDDIIFARMKEGLSGCPDRSHLISNILRTSLLYLITHPRIFPYALYPFIRILSALGSDLIDKSMEEEVAVPSKVPPPFKLANLQAAVGLQQLSKLDATNERSMQNAKLFNKELRTIKSIEIPEACPRAKHIYLYYRILKEDAEIFRRKLLGKGIDTKRDDMSNCAGLDVFAPGNTDCPVARRLPARSVELPNAASLTQSDILYISKCIRETAGEIAKHRSPQ